MTVTREGGLSKKAEHFEDVIYGSLLTESFNLSEGGRYDGSTLLNRNCRVKSKCAAHLTQKDEGGE